MGGGNHQERLGGGSKSHIVTPQQQGKFPHFREEKADYLTRSKELGENMFRFGLDFARMCPEKGKFNEELMGDFIRTLARIKAQGQEPMVTMYHWPMPNYLVTLKPNGEIDRGGWENPKVADHFRFYVEEVVKHLNNEDFVRKNLLDEGFNKEDIDKFLNEGLVRYFISINEPTSILLPGYLAGVFPPFKIGKVFEAKKVLERLVQAHDIAQAELKKGSKKFGPITEAQVGVAHAWTYFDGVLGKIVDEIMNKQITKSFERTGAYSDFLALQYYFRMRILPLTSPEKPLAFGEHPDFGDIYPKGIYHLLKEMHDMYPRKEIFLTEFGFADKNDKRRPLWIMETVRYIIEAVKNKVPVKGMLLWSLVNNFEWAQGMEVQFGLFKESELGKPLKPESGKVRSWEVWQAIIKTLNNPSEENLKELDNLYQKAKEQFQG